MTGFFVHNLADLINFASRETCDTNNLFDRDAFFKKSKYTTFLRKTNISGLWSQWVGKWCGWFGKWGAVSQLFRGVSEYFWRGLPYGVRVLCSAPYRIKYVLHEVPPEICSAGPRDSLVPIRALLTQEM